MILSALLGIDEEVLKETSTAEQSGYRLTGILFASVCTSVVAADAWFGWMFHGSWLAVILAGNFLGYIHFAVYRLAMITLTTRSLTIPANIGEDPAGNFIKTWFRMDAAALFRLVFVGLIALAVAFPGAALFFFREAEIIQQSHRLSLLASEGAGSSLAPLSDPDLRFPFEVFRTLLHRSGYQLILFLWVLWIFTPMLLLTRLRHASGMEYTKKIALLHRQQAERDFSITLLEAQQDLEKDFGKGFKLSELIIYEDPPFNTRLRNLKNLQFGKKSEFKTFLQSL